MDNKKKREEDFTIVATELHDSENGIAMTSAARVDTRDARPLDKDVDVER